MHFLLTLAVAAIAATQTPDPLRRSDTMLVRKVIDGDTIDVVPIGRVSLLGVTASLDGAARERLASLVLQRWVRLEYDPAAASRRQVYVVRDDGVFVNAALVGDGLARVVERRALTRLADLQRAERDAQARRVGIWAKTDERQKEKGKRQK